MPTKVGVLSAVTSSVLEPPVSEAAVRSGTLGAAGGVVSITSASLSARFWPPGIVLSTIAFPARSRTSMIVKPVTLRSALLSPAPTV